MIEETILIIKPHLLKKNFTGEIINILKRNNLNPIALKMIKLSKKKAKEFYEEHKEKTFFEEIVKNISNSPLIVICIQGENAIEKNRKIIGKTNPKEAEKKSIRNKYGESIEFNAVHGSDSKKSAKREIELFFKKNEFFLKLYI